MNAEGARVSWRAGGAAIAAVGVVFAVLVGGWLVRTHVYLAGTDSVAPKFNLPPLRPGHKLCLRSLQIPKGANAIRLRMIGAGRAAPVTMRISADGRELVSRGVAPATTFGGDFRFPTFRRDTAAEACVTSGRVVEASSGLSPSTTAPQGNAYLDGRLVGRASVWYLRPQQRLISALPTAAHRASLFRPGFVGAWTYWVLAAIVLVACASGLRLMFRSDP